MRFKRKKDTEKPEEKEEVKAFSRFQSRKLYSRKQVDDYLNTLYLEYNIVWKDIELLGGTHYLVFVELEKK